MRCLYVALASTMTFFLVACGGGLHHASDDGTVTGYFIDYEGIQYVTPSHSGITGTNGSFLYIPGEEVTFELGDVVLGNTTARPNVSLFDIVSGAHVINGTTTIDKELWNRASPFQAVINLGVLLQTFDDDGDASNGITITPSVTSLFTGFSLNFRQHWSTFPHNAKFRQVLNTANNTVLFNDYRTACHPALALNHLYSVLNIPVYVPDNQRTYSQHSFYSYDDNGFQTQETVDLNSDEIWDTKYTTIFDTAGNRTSAWSEFVNEATPYELSSYTYDVDGNLTVKIRYNVLNDTVDKTRFEYDNNENRVKATVKNASNSIENYTSTWTYDDIGRVLTEHEGLGNTNSKIDSYTNRGAVEVESMDSNGDGVFEVKYTHDYNDQGQLKTTHTDTNNDGVDDIISTYEYDNHGNQTKYKYDVKEDGSAEFIHTYEFDEKDRMMKESYFTKSNDKPDSIYSYEYNDNGYQTKASYDYEADGKVDQTTITTYKIGGWGYHFRWLLGSE